MKKIKKRLQEFRNLKEVDYKKEFFFCILTPQSKAQSCWQAVEELSTFKKLTTEKVTKILASKTRFHHTKTQRILKAQKIWPNIQQQLSNKNTIELRNTLAKQVNGYGLKEASHFLRNIGKSNNKIAILDRHILKNLHKLKLIDEPKIKSPKHYLKLEQIFLNYAQQQKIKPDELDLLWWSKENGEVFK